MLVWQVALTLMLLQQLSGINNAFNFSSAFLQVRRRRDDPSLRRRDRAILLSDCATTVSDCATTVSGCATTMSDCATPARGQAHGLDEGACMLVAIGMNVANVIVTIASVLLMDSAGAPRGS